MIFELFMRFVVITFDSRFFKCAIHSFDLSVRPRMIDFRQPMFDSVLTTNAVKQVHERPFVLFTIGELNAVVSQNRVNAIRHDRNQLPQKPASRITGFVRVKFGIRKL